MSAAIMSIMSPPTDHGNFTRITGEQLHLPWSGVAAIGRYLTIYGTEYRITSYDPTRDMYGIYRASPPRG
jgi:hypothetical protein